jgi:hypothetical protein
MLTSGLINPGLSHPRRCRIKVEATTLSSMPRRQMFLNGAGVSARLTMIHNTAGMSAAMAPSPVNTCSNIPPTFALLSDGLSGFAAC